MTTRGFAGAGDGARRKLGGCKQHVTTHDATIRGAATGSVDGGVATPCATSGNESTIDGRSVLAFGFDEGSHVGFSNSFDGTPHSYVGDCRWNHEGGLGGVVENGVDRYSHQERLARYQDNVEITRNRTSERFNQIRIQSPR